MRYRLSTATAYHANRALSHAVWAITVAAGAVIAQATFGTSGALATVTFAWAGYEVLKAALSAARARKAGQLEKQVPTFSVYEGRFVSVGLEGGEGF
jgi:hypothetical protein